MAKTKTEKDVEVLFGEYIKTNWEKSEFARTAEAALHKAGYKKVIVFNHEEQLVMVNTFMNWKNIESGIVLNSAKDKIIGFKNSDDMRSVTTDALARCLLFETIKDPNDRMRLKVLTKTTYNWIFHYITKNDSGEALYPRFVCNAHTHGMNAYGQLDFQVTLDIGKENISYLLNAIAERVRDGERFEDGSRIKGVYTDSDLKLKKVREGGRDVLRVLIPDNEKNYPGDSDCSYPYSEQAIDYENMN